MYKILVVEDEADMRELLYNYLVNEGYEVRTAADGVEAVDAFDGDVFDLVLLDIMLPEIDGFGVCQLIRRKSDVPVIFLSALDGEEQLIKGYDYMADDYVTKPFSMPVLLRKIAAVIRRRNDTGDASQKIRYKDILIDKDTMEVTLGGREIKLTVKEYEILCLFAENPGKVYTREALIDRIWPYNEAVEDRVIDSHIKNLRRKIGEDYIETVRGAGYRASR